MSGYAVVQIAGVDLEDDAGNKCKCYILDAGNFQQTVAGNATFAADGTPYLQTLDIGGGRAFGIRVDFIPPGKLQDAINAINTAISGGNPFNVTATDDITSIDSDCIPDYSAGFLKIEEQRTNPTTVKGVTFRFITAT